MRKILLAGTLVAASLVARPASAATCAAPAAGGEWRSYGRDLSNTRSQPDETRIGTGNVGAVVPDKIFAADAAAGVFQGTPIVADGCVYVASDGGWVYALNADTLETVWSRDMQIAPGGFGGDIVGSLGIHGGRVIVPASKKSEPFVSILDQATGAPVRDITIEIQRDAYINASALIYDDLLLQGFAGLESTAHARGGYVVIDLRPGPTQYTILKHVYTIDDADYAAGYRGASVWSTGAVDADTGFAYVGGGNPASKRIEHKHSNALLKIDLRRGSPTFGEIVDAYKGNVDQYYPGLDRQPACAIAGDRFTILNSWSVTCLQLDLDFGASPNIFLDAFGHKLVGALQKSGVYHAVNADEMSFAWTNVAGLPCFACNAASSATDGSSIFVAAVPPGQMVSLAADYGAYRWVSPIGDGVHFQPVATANGVVYTMDTLGFLNAFDAELGIPLLRRAVSNDVGEIVANLASSGVVVARSTLYAAAGGYVVAYR